MKLGAWLICWPLLGLLWFSSTGADMLSDATDALDGTINQLLDFAESGDDPPSGACPA